MLHHSKELYKLSLTYLLVFYISVSMFPSWALNHDRNFIERQEKRSYLVWNRMSERIISFNIRTTTFGVPNSYTSPHLGYYQQDLKSENCNNPTNNPNLEVYYQGNSVQLTGDINPFVLEISPSGSCRRRGHSFADGTYQTREDHKPQSIRSYLMV